MALPGLEELARRTAEAVTAEDPTAFLLADHDWQRQVLSALRGRAHDPAANAALHADLIELQQALELHIRREEEVYFPAVEPAMQAIGRGSTLDMYGEHDAIRIRTAELLQVLGGEAPAVDAFGALARALLIHFETEEELIFADVPPHLPAEARIAILEGFASLE